MKRSTRISVGQSLKCIQAIQELQEEINLLHIPYEKLNGDGLNGLSYSELASLESMLKQGLLLVEEETDKAYEELATMQIVASGVMGMEWFDKIEKEDLAHQSLLASRRTALRNKSRELRLRRMIGKELDGMSYAELYVLGFEITRGLVKAKEEIRKIKHASRVSKESISLDTTMAGSQ